MVCAVAAFAVAFYAAGAGKAPARHITHHKPVPFADTAAGGVAVSFSGTPAALKLPPPPKHVKHHAKPAASVTATPTSTAAPATSTPSAPVHVSAPPVKHKSPAVTGTGTGTTVVGP